MIERQKIGLETMLAELDGNPVADIFIKLAVEVPVEEYETVHTSHRGMDTIASPEKFATPFTNPELVAMAVEVALLTRNLNPDEPITVELLKEFGLHSDTFQEPILTLHQNDPQPRETTVREALEQIFTAMVDGSGINLRHASPMESPTYTESDLIARNVEVGARLVREMIEKTGPFTRFYYCSAFLPESMPKAILEAAGLYPDQIELIDIQNIRAYCSGSALAIVHSLVSPDRDQYDRVAILVQEATGFRVSLAQFSLENIMMAAIFEDEQILTSYRPEEFELLGGYWKIIYDGGLVRIMPLYKLLDHAHNPAYLQELTESAASQDFTIEFVPSDDPQAEQYSLSEDGYFMETPPVPEEAVEEAAEHFPQILKSWMDGKKTGIHFAKHTPDVILHTYLLAKAKGHLIRTIIAHQPSLAVVNGINKRLERLIEKDPDLTAEDFENIKLPFTLGETGDANSSAGTLLRAFMNEALAYEKLVEAKERGELPDEVELPDLLEAFMIGAPGVYSNIIFALLRWLGDEKLD